MNELATMQHVIDLDRQNAAELITRHSLLMQCTANKGSPRAKTQHMRLLKSKELFSTAVTSRYAANSSSSCTVLCSLRPAKDRRAAFS